MADTSVSFWNLREYPSLSPYHFGFFFFSFRCFCSLIDVVYVQPSPVPFSLLCDTRSSLLDTSSQPPKHRAHEIMCGWNTPRTM